MFMGWAMLGQSCQSKPYFSMAIYSLVFPLAKIAPSHCNFAIKKEKFASEK